MINFLLQSMNAHLLENGKTKTNKSDREKKEIILAPRRDASVKHYFEFSVISDLKLERTLPYSITGHARKSIVIYFIKKIVCF